MVAYLAEHGVDLEGGRVLLLTNARVLGYVFNPLSVYYCHDRDGDLALHRGRGAQHLRRSATATCCEPGERGRAETDKDFYVSPFLTVDGRYRMNFAAPGERLSVQMELLQGERRVFSASLTRRRGAARPNAAVRRMLVRHPLMTARVTGADPLHGVQAARCAACAACPARRTRPRSAWDDGRLAPGGAGPDRRRRRAPSRARAAIARALFERSVRRLPLRVDPARRRGGRRTASRARRVMVIERDAFLRRLAADGKIGFGEAYMAGDWAADDLAAVLGVFAGRVDHADAAAAAAPGRLYEPLDAAQRAEHVDRRGAEHRPPLRPLERAVRRSSWTRR